MPADVRAKCKVNSSHSPTEQLFDLLEACQPDLTVTGLIKALEDIGRRDVVEFKIKKNIPGMENCKVYFGLLDQASCLMFEQ